MRIKKARIFRSGPFVVWSSSGQPADLPGSARSAAVAPVAERPAGPLPRAKLPIGIHRPARAFEVGGDREAVLPAAKPVAFRRLHLNFVHSRPQRITRSADEIVALANFDIRLALAIAVEAKLDDPVSHPLALDDRIRRHVEILNEQTIAAAAPAAPAIWLRGCIHGEADEQQSSQRPEQSYFRPLHRLTSFW